MSRLARDGTAEPVSRDQILRRERGQGNIHFPCSADHVQDWQPYPVDPYSCYMCDHTIPFLKTLYLCPWSKPLYCKYHQILLDYLRVMLPNPTNIHLILSRTLSFSFTKIYFVEAAALRSIVLRCAGAPIAKRVFFVFFNWRCRFFWSIFCTIAAFSLKEEYVVRYFLPDGVFLPCDHGLDFLRQLMWKFNQSINHCDTVGYLCLFRSLSLPWYYLPRFVDNKYGTTYCIFLFNLFFFCFTLDSPDNY